MEIPLWIQVTDRSNLNKNILEASLAKLIDVFNSFGNVVVTLISRVIWNRLQRKYLFVSLFYFYVQVVIWNLIARAIQGDKSFDRETPLRKKHFRKLQQQFLASQQRYYLFLPLSAMSSFLRDSISPNKTEES